MFYMEDPYAERGAEFEAVFGETLEELDALREAEDRLSQALDLVREFGEDHPVVVALCEELNRISEEAAGLEALLPRV